MPQAFTPVEKFSKDHWSTFAYAESCCVDGKDGVGQLALAKMRCNGTKRPLMGANARWQPSWGTRLMGFFDFPERQNPDSAAAAGLQLLDHDDWDCVDDLEAAGFLEVLNGTHGRVRMTSLGNQVAAAARKHKTEGKQYATFVWSGVSASAAAKVTHA